MILPDTTGRSLTGSIQLSTGLWEGEWRLSISSTTICPPGRAPEYIQGKDIDEFYITGADATACVKSTCFNMTKAGYNVHVISDCVTSYDLKKMDEMLAYYTAKGCEVKTLEEYKDFGITDGGTYDTTA